MSYLIRRTNRAEMARQRGGRTDLVDRWYLPTRGYTQTEVFYYAAPSLTANFFNFMRKNRTLAYNTING